MEKVKFLIKLLFSIIIFKNLNNIFRDKMFLKIAELKEQSEKEQDDFKSQIKNYSISSDEDNDKELEKDDDDDDNEINNQNSENENLDESHPQVVRLL
jgi:uncharacterized protein YxeA